MVVLNTRSRDILLILLRSSEPLGSKVIAQQLAITPRMVRYNIDTITKWLAKRGGKLVTKPNYGLFVEAENGLKQELIHEIENLSGYPLKLSSDERWRIISLKLLLTDGPISASRIMDQLHISRTTLFKDIDRVESWMEIHGVDLSRKPGEGFKINTEQIIRRVAIEEYLLENVGEMTLLDLCSGSDKTLRINLKGRVGLLRALQTFIDELDLCSAEKMVRACEADIGCKYTDSAYLSLVLQLAIMVWENQRGLVISIGKGQLEKLQSYPEYQVAEQLSQQLKSLSGIVFSNVEIAYFCMQLLGAQTRWTVANIVGNCEPLQITPEIEQLVEKILSTAATYLHPGLKTDPQLALALALHLKPILFRLEFDLPIRNPLLDEARKSYPYAYKVAKKCVTVIEDKLPRRVPEAEVGKIAMHLAAAMERMRPNSDKRRKVAVVCGEGISTAWLVVSRLQVEVPEIEVIEIMSLLEVSRKKTFQGELDGLISTVPLNLHGIPTVVISPMLTDEDKVHIREVFYTKGATEVVTETRSLLSGPSLQELISEETIGVKLSAREWQEVVHLAGNLLVRSGAIQQEYIHAMVDIIEQQGPYMVVLPGVVLLHAKPEYGVNRMGISLVTLKSPVEFGHPINDPVEIAIVLSTVGGQLHLNALLKLVDILQKKTCREKIMAAKQARKIISIINTEG